ncbi:MAG: DUF29 domain-containing protein [Acaryochloridaceae cyanobacterium RL_2_7]|nr:DUF29 domain-containing protein [Acaryochloridaceae cyanobacterium RL_2_7]
MRNSWISRSVSWHFDAQSTLSKWIPHRSIFLNTETLTENLTTLYDQDFVVWTQDMAQALKRRDLTALDWNNLVEEIQDLGKRDQREVASRLLVVLTHLLKWQYQPQRRSYPGSDNDFLQNSWARSIAENRDQIQRLLAQSPSLRGILDKSLDSCYQKARKQAAQETGLDIQTFPEFCGYTQTQILDDDFWPENKSLIDLRSYSCSLATLGR